MSAPGLYSLYSDVLTPLATWTWQAGTPDANYPIANIKDGRPDTTAQVTGASGTARATFGASKTLQGVVIANTNASAISIQNGAGLNVSVSIIATPLDSARFDPWKDLRGVANTSSTTWDIVLTGPGPTIVGEVLLVQTWREIPILWGLKIRERHGGGLLETDYGTRNKWIKGVRQRQVVSDLIDGAYDSAMLDLIRDCHGMVRNFPLILDEAVSDAMYVDLTEETFEYTKVESGVTSRQLTFTEQQKGII